MESGARRDRDPGRGGARRPPPRRRRAPRRPVRARPAAAAALPVGPPRRTRLRAVARGRGALPPARRGRRGALRDPRRHAGRDSPGRSAPRPGSASCRRRPPAPASRSGRPASRAEELDRVAIASASGVHAVPLAEWSLLGLLAFTKGLPRLRRDAAERRWDHYPVDELRGRTLLVVGVGEIGAEVARLASAFGMRVLGVKRDAERAGRARRGAVSAVRDRRARRRRSRRS